MRSTVARRLAIATALAVVGTVVLAPAVGADSYRTRGTGQHFNVSWTEHDPDDLLQLPGNTHVGWLGGWSDQYGTYFYGQVTDFDCDPGEVPWGGGHVEVIAEEASETATDAAEDAVDDIVESGASVIDGEEVIEAVQSELAETVSETIEDEIKGCDYIQDRFLDGAGTVEFEVDLSSKSVIVSGTVTVSHGGHGEPGQVLATPPINLTISGGDWYDYESFYKTTSANYKYSDWRQGTDYYGGTVTGAIGAMGFADDPDDEAWGGFGLFAFKTVERIR